MIRVAVTGFGAVTPLGIGADATWRSMRAGLSGIRQIGEDIAGNAPVRIAGVVDASYIEALSVPERRRLDPSEQYALLAGREAWNRGGRPQVDPDRFATVIGTATGGTGTLIAQDRIRLAGGPRQVSPHALTMFIPNGPAAWLSMDLGARAGAFAPTTACAAGAEAIAAGVDLIRSGTADVVLAGGTEAAVSPIMLTGFSRMRALSTSPDASSASRPFDVDRDGFVLSEGSAVLLLEREDHARARGATIYSYVDGTAITSDARDIVNADPHNQARAIARALRDADAEARDVELVHAHATSTLAGDRNEATALSIAGIAAPVTATKSMTGHLLGAAGALGTLAALLAIYHRAVPPTVNLRSVDPEIQHDIVTLARPTEAGTALVNSFGFGGQNVALILRRS